MIVASGTRVAVRQRLLEPHERAPSLPEDTATLPYEALVRGILLEPAEVGAQATIRTAAGRVVAGQLEIVEPADAHTFGRPPAALVAVDEAISELLRRCRE
jgi:hypothetical protein